MTKCAFKNCKNNSSIQLKKDGVTYHRFPKNFVVREKWRKILAKVRFDEFYKPKESSIICSKHFSESDLYDTIKGFKRLKRNAVPQVQALDVSSVKSDSDDDDSEHVDKVHVKTETISLQEPKSPEREFTMIAIKEEVMIEVDAPPPPGSDAAGAGSSANLTEQPSEINEEFSDLDSCCDSPIEAMLRKQLRSKIVIQKRQKLKIESITRKNKRLLKKVAALKKVIETLKKQGKINK